MKGAKLEVAQADDLPRLSIVTIWIPGNPEPTGEVIGKLGTHNPWVNINEWCVFRDTDKSDPTEKLIVFGVSEKNAAALLIKRQDGRSTTAYH